MIKQLTQEDMGDKAIIVRNHPSLSPYPVYITLRTLTQYNKQQKLFKRRNEVTRLMIPPDEKKCVRLCQ